MRSVRLALLCAAFALSAESAAAAALRVCADPNAMPFSDRKGEGFENKIADIVAEDLGLQVAYTFAAQHENFIKHTLDAHKCDVVMSVPAGDDEVAETRPYYASSYVFVSRKSDRLAIASLEDPRLRRLRIGVHLIAGDDQPPEIALGEEGIVDNVKGYLMSADRARPDPSAAPIEAVRKGDIDIAAVWGPIGGYYAARSRVPLVVVPLTDTVRFAPLRFRFAIAIGVRKGDALLQQRLDSALARQASAIAVVLTRFDVPLIAAKGVPDG